MSNPYLVETPAQLDQVRNHLTNHFLQVQDLDLSSYSNWSPIGISPQIFLGTYNGGTNTIRNLIISRSSEDNVGLFGCVGSSGRISHLGLEGGTIQGGWNVGSLVGQNNGSVIECYATTDVTGDIAVGGLIGGNYGEVIRCYTSNSVTGNTSAGGLIGVSDNIIKDCYAIGNVNGDRWVGGLVAAMYGGSITSSYSAAFVDGNEDVGGFLGGQYGGDVAACFWDIDTSGQDASAGGTGERTANMKKEMTYSTVGWDFTSVWTIDEGSSYPHLRVFSTPLPSYTLVYMASAGGVILGETNQSVNANADGTLVSAEADVGALFHQWSDGLTTHARIDTSVTSNIEVTASFISSAGIPIDWYAQHRLTPVGEQTWRTIDNYDSDNDGMKNSDEYVADTNPTNANSVLRLQGLKITEFGMHIEWQGGVQARQILERANDLTDPDTWQPILTNDPPTGIQEEYLDAPPNPGPPFYRITVERQ